MVLEMNYFLLLRYSWILSRLIISFVLNKIISTRHQILTGLKQLQLNFSSISTLGMLLLLNSSAHAAEPKWGLKAAFSFIRPDVALAERPGSGYEAGLSYQIRPQLGLEIAAQNAAAHDRFEVIGAPAERTITLRQLTAGLSFRALRWKGWFDVFLSGNAGVLEIRSERYTVSLGALGSRDIPARSETYAIYGLGAGVVKSLGNGFHAFVSPRVGFYFASGMKRIWNVNGGLQFAI